MGYRYLDTGNTLTIKTMEKKESYIVIDGVRYDAVKQEGGTLGVCQGCVFDGCTLPKTDGFSIDCGEEHIFVSRGEVAAQQQLTERNEEELGLDNPIGFSNAKLNTLGPPPEKHPSGEKDICRYLSFNLGNVVKCVCQASRKDADKKVEDLRKAMDYLENEIKRMEEEDD